jgi:hypothetical protein
MFDATKLTIASPGNCLILSPNAVGTRHHWESSGRVTGGDMAEWPLRRTTPCARRQPEIGHSAEWVTKPGSIRRRRYGRDRAGGLVNRE